MAQLVKNPPAMEETWVRSMVWEDPLEKGKATHSSTLAWSIPWTVVHGVAKSWTRLTFTHSFHTHGGALTFVPLAVENTHPLTGNGGGGGRRIQGKNHNLRKSGEGDSN